MKLENSNQISTLDQQDIEELDQKIEAFKSGSIPEERFKHFRLTRGVYGQRQFGVHMFRTKLPMGKLNAQQLNRLAEISDQYATGNLHLTTRQNIQFHYVKLNDATAIWSEMAEVGLNAREACGNTVRNITTSATAGIDKHEPFDVTPYANWMYQHFLRNAICQEMGRKIKIAFSSSHLDTAFTYFHDFGFIPKIEEGVKGFKVLVGGGLGAVSMVAHTVFDFLPADQILTFTEATVRIFDRYGERERRQKARMKFLIKSLGLDKFLELVNAEMKAVPAIDHSLETAAEEIRLPIPLASEEPTNHAAYALWKQTNVFEQKQPGYFGVNVKVRLGDIHATVAKQFAEIVPQFAADDIRITVNQGLLLRYVPAENLYGLYVALSSIGLADSGFGSIADITACPGTDTCNLGVTNSTALANELEQVIWNEYPKVINRSDIEIKISGCMNACGQHMASPIGLHGSSIKIDGKVAPAMQIILGGGVTQDGKGHIGDKIIKLITRRIPNALRTLLNDFDANQEPQEEYIDYYLRQGKKYFYNLLKPLASQDDVDDQLFFDWGQSSDYVQEIGVGECAGVAYDMVSTIVNDAKERLTLAKKAYKEENWGASIYYSYSTFVIGAKAMLLSEDIKCNTHKGIINDFDIHFVQNQRIEGLDHYVESASSINKHEPSSYFALSYVQEAEQFLDSILSYRREALGSQSAKAVIAEHYRA